MCIRSDRLACWVNISADDILTYVFLFLFFFFFFFFLRKQAFIFHHYENTPIQIYRKFHLTKTENFQIIISDIFHMSAQNIDCGYSLEPPLRGGSNEYPQSMFWAEIRKIMYTPCKPHFYYIKVGFKGGQFYIGVFSWCANEKKIYFLETINNLSSAASAQRTVG